MNALLFKRYGISGATSLCLLLASTVNAENPSQKVIHVNTVKELYSAVSNSANRGATVRLAPGTYLLSTMNERGVLRRNRGAFAVRERHRKSECAFHDRVRDLH